MEELGTENYLNNVFEALSSSERRHIIEYLKETGYATGDSLINYLEGTLGVKYDIDAVFENNYLPKLEDAGWIDYSENTSEVRDYEVFFDVKESDEEDAAVLGYLDQVFDQDEEDLDNLFIALQNPVRRRTLYWLNKDKNNSGLDRLATYLAMDRAERDSWRSTDYKPTREETRRLKANMVDIYLPKLEEAGIIEYDVSSQRICLTEEYLDPDNLLIDFLEMTYGQD